MFLVTGANSGLGFETARALAQKGAHVLFACRSPSKAEAALERIRTEHPDARLTFVPLDLADLKSVHHAANEVLRLAPALHGLCNNAGLMALPFSHTLDGFEMQIGVNHLGHFALSALVYPALLQGHGRVVTVSSHMHRIGELVADDLSYARRPYGKWRAYAQSKLANLLFTYALDRRLRGANKPVMALAAHPGYSATELAFKGPDAEGSRAMHALMQTGAFAAQSQTRGALPQLRALLDRTAQSGEYYGPKGLFEVWGDAGRVDSNAKSKDTRLQEELWQTSERLTHVSFNI